MFMVRISESHSRNHITAAIVQVSSPAPSSWTMSQTLYFPAPMRCHAPHQPRPEDEGEVEVNIKEEQGCKCCLSSFQMKLVIIGLKLDGVAARSDTSDSVSSLGQWQSRETDPFYMLHITTTLPKQRKCISKSDI